MKLEKLFGTDGIRGSTKSVNLQPENVEKLGVITGRIARVQQYGGEGSMAKDPFIVIGHDGRASAGSLEAALVRGIISQGVDCHSLGLMPTAAVAYLGRHMKAVLSIVISASHNQSYDNGFKFFDARGFKINEAIESKIEASYLSYSDLGVKLSLIPGKTFQEEEWVKAYYQAIFDRFFNLCDAKPLNIVVDCAHGAASVIAPAIFSRLQMNATFICANPDGKNINLGCGSEYPELLRGEVIRQKADLGIAFDGDADRVVFIDEKGETIDGDAILAVIARDLFLRGRLFKNTVVATIMSSVALDRALADYGILVKRTEVGDKHVARTMMNEGFCFGGESSGHFIMFPETTTGDGIFSSLRFLEILQQAEGTASELLKFYQPTPKLVKNIEVSQKVSFDALPKTWALINHCNHLLKSLGRVMTRYSGTENKLRILVEAPSLEECHRIANSISAEFQRENAAL